MPAMLTVYRDVPVMTTALCPGAPFSLAENVHLQEITEKRNQTQLQSLEQLGCCKDLLNGECMHEIVNKSRAHCLVLIMSPSSDRPCTVYVVSATVRSSDLARLTSSLLDALKRGPSNL